MAKKNDIRILEIFEMLQKGRPVKKTELSMRFGISDRTVQRDIDDIRAYLADMKVSESSGERTVVYDRTNMSYKMQGCENPMMNNSEILAVCKIILESRAFKKDELKVILGKLISGCVPEHNLKMMKELIANEAHHYVELEHESYLSGMLWKLGESIKKYKRLEIEYMRQDSSDSIVRRTIEPAGIMFSEYYFYLNAYIVEKNETGKYVRKHDYPTIFRIDRIKECRELGEKFKFVHAGRFEEGEYRKRVQFMYGGELMRLEFKYRGINVQSILDRLPTAEIVDRDPADGSYILKAEVFGKGIIMWLLSQGKQVEVIRPVVLRDEMKRIISDMAGIYGCES